MRTRTAGEDVVLNAAQKSIPHTKVEIKNAGGSYVDWFAYLLGVNWGASIDQPIAEVRLQLRRDNGLANSLSPFRGDSSLNIGGAAIDAGRDFKLSPATVAWDAGAVGTDYKLLFIGKTADIDFANSAMEILARDQGSTLVKKQIKVASEYRIAAGEPFETVLQRLLDTWAPGVTLSVPVSPGFLVTTINWGKGSLFEALRTAAGKIGWDIRYVWNPTLAQFDLTLFEPDRTKTVPDWTFAKNRILKVTQLRISDEFVRNVIDVSYYDNVTGIRETDRVTDPVSVARFGEQWMEIEEADDSPINTATEATALAQAALADLAWPIAEKQVEIPFFWPVEIGDLIRFTADDIWADEDIDLAVTGFEHRLGKEARTILTVRGKPAGFYKSWLVRPKRTREDVKADLQLYGLKAIDPTNTTITWRMDAGAGVDNVWVWDELDEPITRNTEVLRRLDLDDLRQAFYTAELPPEEHTRNLMFVGVSADLKQGEPWFTTVHPKPDQAPEFQKKPKENGLVGTLWIKAQSRGILVTNVQAQTQVGTLPFSALAAPTRAPGGSSVVNGGTLGTSEYEQDVDLDSYDQALIQFLVTLATGETVTVASPPFDRNRYPDFVTEPLPVNPLHISGDSDTISIKIERVGGGTWVRQIDSWTAIVDVTAIDDTANAGQANDTSALYRITLRDHPTADVDVNTLTDVREVTITIGTSSEPVWDDVQALAPAISSGTMTIKLDASSAPGGYTAKVWARSQMGGDPFGAWANVTASLSPALSAPPTALTSYTYATGFTRIAKDITKPIVTLEIRAEILNGSSVVVTTQARSANWYSNPPL